MKQKNKTRQARIRITTLKELDKRKLVQEETYSSVIDRLLKATSRDRGASNND